MVMHFIGKILYSNPSNRQKGAAK